MNNFGINVAIESNRPFVWNHAMEQIRYIQKDILEDANRMVEQILEMEDLQIFQIRDRLMNSIMNSYGESMSQIMSDYLNHRVRIEDVQRVWALSVLNREISLSAKLLGADDPDIRQANRKFGILVLEDRSLELWNLICRELSDAAESAEYRVEELKHIPFGEFSLHAKAAANYLMGSAA